ncbi:MAG: hypothetical protein HPY81_06390 [Firmicutes bacterium]|nr:hypothetical protein [Bacillota bacterium]
MSTINKIIGALIIGLGSISIVRRHIRGVNQQGKTINIGVIAEIDDVEAFLAVQ